MDKNFEKIVEKLQGSIIEDAKKIYSQKTIEYFIQPKNLGRMKNPDATAAVKGLCGDTMEMYLMLKDERISEALFFTDGCGPTIACGSVVTEIVKGENIKKALKVLPADVIDKLGGLPEESIHCAILAVITLHQAIAEYLLKKQIILPESKFDL